MDIREKVIGYLDEHPGLLDQLYNKRRKSCGDSNKLKQLRSQNSESDFEGDLFMTLVRDIANELDLNKICHLILVNVCVLTNASKASLFLTRVDGGQKQLIAKLFDVTRNSVFDSRPPTPDIVVPFGKGIVGHVAETGQPVNIVDAYNDERFNPDVDKKTGFVTNNVLCLPILDVQGVVLGVAEIINKVDGDLGFSDDDGRVFGKYLIFCGIGIKNAILYEKSVDEYRNNKLMLEMAKEIFEEQTDLNKVVSMIMRKIREIILCEKYFVFIKDEANSEKLKLSKEFSLGHRESESEPVVLETDNIESNKLTSIAIECVSTNKVIKINNCSCIPEFEDCISGTKVHRLLAVPIQESNGVTQACAILVNTLSGLSFDECSQSAVEAFAIFCGLGIHNTLMYEKASKLMAKQKISLEVLAFHATAQDKEVSKFVKHSRLGVEDLGLDSFMFSDFTMTDTETLLGSLAVLTNLDVMDKYKIPYESLCRFVLSIRKNYRPVIYHNWRHAFNVTQTMFTILNKGGISQYFSHIEQFAMFIACLCHDLDHRGTNNTFMNQTNSPLAQLYSTSTLEHHHFDHFIMILNSDKNNILDNLSSAEYSDCINLIESCILSTDLAQYFKKNSTFISMSGNPETRWEEPTSKSILIGMLMTACDVAAIAKPFEVQEKIAHFVASEFYEQGELEKKNVGVVSGELMDRSKECELPRLQVDFIDHVCSPLYKALAETFHGLKPMYDQCMKNRNNWLLLSEKRRCDKAADVDEGNGECVGVDDTKQVAVTDPMLSWRQMKTEKLFLQEMEYSGTLD